MKRSVSVLLAVCLLPLTACGGDEKTAVTENTTVTTKQMVSTTASVDTTVTTTMDELMETTTTAELTTSSVMNPTTNNTTTKTTTTTKQSVSTTVTVDTTFTTTVSEPVKTTTAVAPTAVSSVKPTTTKPTVTTKQSVSTTVSVGTAIATMTSQPTGTTTTAESTTVSVVKPTTTVTTTTKPTPTTTKTTTTTATTTTTVTTQPTTPDKPTKEWELYWSDEFDGNTLDKSKWNIESGTNGPVVKKADNVKVEDGNCVLTIRRDDSTPGYEYSSAYVTTAYKFSFCFGRLEFRAKLPTGQGMWPALWTLGDNYLTIGDDAKAWPLCGEIDVMELVGSSDPQNPFDNKKIMGTLHWGADRDSHEQAHKMLFLSENAANDYHVYAIEWDVDSIVWFVDDREYMRVALDDPDMGMAFLQKHWIIMNINLNEWDGYNKHDDTTPLPQSMYVDYVRVYKEKK